MWVVVVVASGRDEWLLLLSYCNKQNRKEQKIPAGVMGMQ